MKARQNAQRSALNAQRSMFSVRPSHPRRGATLIVTLGILTVLSVMVVTFLLTSRLQRQTATGRQNRLAARNSTDAGLLFAMRHIEDAFTYPNYTDQETDPDDFLTRQRLAPVSRWFSEHYGQTYQLSDTVSFQAAGVLASPAYSNAPSVNLLTPHVLRLIPSALTNGLTLSAKDPYPFRSGWIPLDTLPDTASADERLRSKPTRVAFTVFDVSGFLDANYFLAGPTTQKLPRVCFKQADVTNWFASAGHEAFSTLKSEIPDLATDPNRMPFSSLSYDPDPDADPLASNSSSPNPYLGLNSFPFSPLPPGVSVTDRPPLPRKFDINSITNLIGSATSKSGDWLKSAALMSDWLRPVYSALARANANEPDTNPDKLTALQSVSIPWNLINFIDADRVPQLSPSANLPENIERIATRANLAVEDVPLINKVSVFNIFGDENGNEPPSGHGPDYYDVDPTLSNHYAVAVELWYPFVPGSLPPDTALYAVLSTNSADTATTTNRPLTRAEIEDWFLWNEAATSNTVMQTLFYAWANAYTNAVSSTIWQHPLWQVVTADAGYWFTTNMVNHSSWPVPDETGHITITNTPIWNAFYPDTYEVVTTNQVELVDTNGVPYLVDLVATNLYTHMTVTNAYVQWIAESDMTTNRLSGQIGVTDPDPYPVLLWSDLDGTVFTTNVCSGFIDLSGNTNLFLIGDQTNHLQHLYATPPDSINVVSSNGLTGAVSTNRSTALILAPWTSDAPLAFSVQTNLYVETEILPVEPLPMPSALGASLNTLFAILLAPDLSLDTSGELYDFLMLLPSEFDEWDLLGEYLAQYPFVQQTLMPSVSAPRTDNLLPEDRIELTDDTSPIPKFIGKEFEGEKETVAQIFDKNSPPPDGNTFTPINDNNGFGTYITIYPRETVAFPEVTIPMMEDGVTPDPDAEAFTNYCELGSKNGYVLYFRPVVTLDDREGVSHTATADAGGTLIDILDEALLVRDNGGNVFPFHSVTNICVADPRNNGYFSCWRGFPHSEYHNDPPDWDSAIGTTNLSTEVTEYPFIHFNTPFTSIGDIGHVYTSPDRLNMLNSGNNKQQTWQDDRSSTLHDTVSFASRSGAALLDLFTVHATANVLSSDQIFPMRGLVQANTLHPSVAETLFSFGMLGWTNAVGSGARSFRADLPDVSDLSDWSDAYLDALTNTPPAGIGWRSFADMLPALSTNALLRSSFSPPFDDAPSHDWIEDAVRHLPDRVSFRQNIFVIIVAAQALSPASTATRPVVLSDQRAAVTVIRDAYTGRWTIHDWQWLTE